MPRVVAGPVRYRRGRRDHATTRGNGCFSEECPALTAREIAAMTGVSESTVTDDAEYLLRLGYLQQGCRTLYRIAEAHLDD